MTTTDAVKTLRAAGYRVRRAGDLYHVSNVWPSRLTAYALLVLARAVEVRRAT